MLESATVVATATVRTLPYPKLFAYSIVEPIRQGWTIRRNLEHPRYTTSW